MATIESIGSSTRIEGSRLSDREVAQLLQNLQIKSFASRDEQEVAGYAELMDLVYASWRDIPFRENHILQLHQVLLRYSEKDDRHRGRYKTSSNSVAAFDETGKQLARIFHEPATAAVDHPAVARSAPVCQLNVGQTTPSLPNGPRTAPRRALDGLATHVRETSGPGIVFQTASPFDTPRLMAELVAWVSQEREAARLHPLLIIALCVVVLLEIHPFQDGNGRLSRVLTTLLLLQAGYRYVPYSSLESVIEQNKEGYYLALRQTQATIRTETPDWQPWLIYFLRSLSEQVRRLEVKVERERTVLAALPELQLQIVEFAGEHGRISMGEAIKLTAASRNTLKQHFRVLVERGTLKQHGRGRGVWYGLG